jgi:hypothetical protein
LVNNFVVVGLAMQLQVVRIEIHCVIAPRNQHWQVLNRCNNVTLGFLRFGLKFGVEAFGCGLVVAVGRVAGVV